MIFTHSHTQKIRRPSVLTPEKYPASLSQLRTLRRLYNYGRRTQLQLCLHFADRIARGDSESLRPRLNAQETCVVTTRYSRLRVCALRRCGACVSRPVFQRLPCTRTWPASHAHSPFPTCVHCCGTQATASPFTLWCEQTLSPLNTSRPAGVPHGGGRFFRTPPVRTLVEPTIPECAGCVRVGPNARAQRPHALSRQNVLSCSFAPGSPHARRCARALCLVPCLRLHGRCLRLRKPALCAAPRSCARVPSDSQGF